MKEIILTGIFFLLSSSAFTAITCSFPGAGNVVWTTVTFNDPDGDCVSNDYVAVHTFADGSWDISTNETNGELDFGYWDCCDPV